MNYIQARYHDPVIGRFLSIDPVGFKRSNPMSFNRYAYANNNPYTYVDPDGEFATLPLAGFGAVVGLIAGATSAAVNGGDFNAVVVAAGAGSALSISGFATSSATGGIAATSEEADQGGVSGEKGDDEKGKDDSNNEEADSV